MADTQFGAEWLEALYKATKRDCDQYVEEAKGKIGSEDFYQTQVLVEDLQAEPLMGIDPAQDYSTKDLLYSLLAAMYLKHSIEAAGAGEITSGNMGEALAVLANKFYGPTEFEKYVTENME